MDRRRRYPLAALLLLATASICRADPDLKPPSNVHLKSYVDEIKLPVRWEPLPALENRSLGLLYQVRLCLPEDPAAECAGPCFCQPTRKGARVLAWPGQEVSVSMRSVTHDDPDGDCRCPPLDSSVNASAWSSPVSKHPVGEPGTGARNVSCVYRDMEALECGWSPGEKAPPGTSYSLRYAAYSDKPLQWTACGVEGPVTAARCGSLEESDSEGRLAILVNGSLPGGARTRHRLTFVTPHETISPSAPRGLRASIVNNSTISFIWDPPNNARLLGFIKYHARLVCVGAKPELLADEFIARRTGLDLAVDPALRYRVSVRAVLNHPGSASSPWAHLDYSPKETSVVPLVIAFGAVLATITAISFLVWRWPRVKVRVWPDIPDPAGPLDAFLKRNVDSVKVPQRPESQDLYSLVEEMPSAQLLQRLLQAPSPLKPPTPLQTPFPATDPPSQLQTPSPS